ncbi:MAG: ferrous iron transport protein A [Candidatus Altiarchaeales archaeon A3]|nr:MAG: ferrous iron transport protein A [Candidatus Altiarchaeales archaeon A3]
MEKTLNELKVGDKAEIVKLKGAGDVKRRLLDMGVVKGTTIEIERVAPLGDPIEIKVRGYNLSLRKEEASKIIVK